MTAAAPDPAGPADAWTRLSLASRYAIAMAGVLVIAGLLIGRYVGDRIEAAVVRNAGLGSAIYLDSLLAPISQQFADADALSPGAARALDELFTQTALGERVISYKFWRIDPDGSARIIEAADATLVGQRFPVGEGLARALDGQVNATLEDGPGGPGAENAAEMATGLPLLEIYMPVRAVWSGEVVAVAEFYEIGTDLAADLSSARRGAWGLVAITLGAIGLLLYAIVLGGSRTIAAQRARLDAQLAAMAELSARNTDLRLRIQAAAGRAASGTEATMRRIGADLHDGPAQYLAFAALRLDSLAERTGPGAPPDPSDLAAIRGAVTQAMDEVRGLSRGLALPDLRNRSLPAIVERAVAAHTLRTGHPVALVLPDEDGPDTPLAIRNAAYRFVQEGLNNASRHAGGADLAVTLSLDGSRIRLSVADGGPGMPAPSARTAVDGGLGLTGLRDRVESLGGRLDIAARPGGGTVISMLIDSADHTAAERGRPQEGQP
jgi:signal transduction histidine kinase